MKEKDNRAGNGNGNHRPIKEEVKPGVFDVTFPENPDAPAISDKIAELVLSEARTEGEREILAEAIANANRAKEEERQASEE